VATPPIVGGVVVAPPGVRVAMVNAAARSRCPANRQWGQVITLPRGLLIFCWQLGQVDEVPRSSTKHTRIPANAALSCRMRRVRPICHCRNRRLCRRPAGRLRNSAWVADRQRADPPVDRPGDHRGGGFVQGLADPAVVAAFDQPGPPSGFAPAP
jgi:hypothetical protein